MEEDETEEDETGESDPEEEELDQEDMVGILSLLPDKAHTMWHV